MIDERTERVALGAVAVGAAVALAWLARRLGGRRAAGPVDVRARRLLHERVPNVVHGAATVVSLPGHPAVYMPGALLVGAWLRRRRASGATAVTVSAIAGWAAHHVVKLFVERDRPPSQAGEKNETRSFPSGHTTATTAVALTVGYTLARDTIVPARRVAPIAIGLALGVGLSRIALDEHWATDVLGGWLAGGAVAALSAELLARISQRRRYPAAGTAPSVPRGTA